MRRLLLLSLLIASGAFGQVTTSPSVSGVPAPQSSVAITGGTIDGTPIGGTTKAAGAFTTVSATGQITSTLADGTAPLVVASTTNVANLNASSLSGATFAAPAAIGTGTPAAATFTALTASGTSTLALTNMSNLLSIAKSTNGTQVLLAVRNADGTASGAGQARVDWGNDLGTNKFTIGLYGSTHATKPGWAEILNQAGNPLVLGTNGNAVITMSGAGATTIANSVTLPGVTTGTNADFVCMSSGNVLTLQTSACTISSKRFKNQRDASGIYALGMIGKMKLAYFTMKPMETPNADWNFDKPQFGLYAEDVAAVDKRLAIYEQDGVTPKSYRQESIIALLVKGMQEQQKQISRLQSKIKSITAVRLPRTSPQQPVGEKP